jgi:hypothetical protein
MKRITLLLPLIALVGCSTWLNDTAPAANAGYVYAVGARQKAFATKATVWLCSTSSGRADSCKIVKVQVTP